MFDMKKIVCFLLIIGCFFELFSADVLVRVGKNFLTKQDLNVYMQENSLSDRVRALEGLIRQQLILDYAKEQGIKIANQEIIQYFQDELGQTVDLASLRKMRAEKSKSLALVQRELTKIKALDLIKSNLNVDVKAILQEFLLQSAKIDISYVLADWSLFDLPENFTYSDLEDFAEENYGMFDKLKKIKFDYAIVLDDEDKSADDLSFLFDDWQVGLQTYRKNVARQLAEDLASAWEDGIRPDRQIFSTDYIRASDQIADFEQVDLQAIFESDSSCFLREIPSGFLLIKKKDEKRVDYLSEDGDYQKVLHDYIAWVAKEDKSQLDPYRKHYEENFYSLADKRVGVKLEFFEFDSLNYLQKLELEERNLKSELLEKAQSDTTIFFFLERFFADKSDLTQQIRQRINKGVLFGSIKDGDKICHYNTIVYNSAYLPDFEQAKNYLYDNVELDEQKQKKYNLEKYYKKYFSKFQRPMQLGISGLLVRFADFDTVQIQDVEIENYYLEYKADFATAGKQRYDFIFLMDEPKIEQNFVKYLAEILNEDNFSYLKKCFGDDFAGLSGNFLDYDDLDIFLQEKIENLGVGEICEPFYYQNGWLILRKGENFSESYLSLEQAKDFIRQKLKKEKEKELALAKISELNDKVRWYNSLKNYQDSPFYFQTKFHSIVEPFEFLGNLMPYEGDFVKMYAQKKYGKIFKLDDGYAVFFLDKLYKSAVMPFEQVKSQIVEHIEVEKNEENARKFLGVFRENLNNGDYYAQKFLTYLGGLQSLENFSVDNKIPWTTSEENEQIFKLAMKGELAKFRPAIYLSCGKYLLYKVDFRTILSKEEFNEKRNDYLSGELNRLCERWLEDYRQKVMIKYYR